MKRVLEYTSMMVSALMVSAACYGSVKSSQQKEQASMEKQRKSTNCILLACRGELRSGQCEGERHHTGDRPDTETHGRQRV